MKTVVVLIYLGLLLLGCAPANQPESGAPLSPLGDAPEFELNKVSGGQFRSQDLKGKVVVVDLWATWCAPCIQEIPNYNALKKEFASEDVEIIGVTLESGSLEDVMPIVEKLGIEYPVVIGTEEVVEGFGGMIGFPTTFLVGKDWKVYRKYLGLTASKKERLKQDIGLLLAE